MKMKVLFAQSCLTLCDHVSTALQAPLSIEFSRLEYWSGLPFPAPGDLPDTGIEPASPAFAAGLFTTEPPGNPVQSYASSLTPAQQWGLLFYQFFG